MHRSAIYVLIIFIAIISSLTTAAWLGFHKIISAQESVAALVNISGRQRMLSQRSALFANLLVESSNGKRALIRRKLKNTIDLMAISNQELTHGDKALKLPATMSPAIHAIYFEGHDPLNSEVETYIKSVQSLLNTANPSLSKNYSLLNHITKVATNRLLTDLDHVTNQYQINGKESIRTLRRYEIIFWIVTLLLLLLETYQARELLLSEAHLRRLNRQIQISENFANRVIDTIPEAIMVVDTEGYIQRINERTKQILGYTEETLLGKPVETLLPEHLRSRHATLREGFSSEATVRSMGNGRDLFALHQNGHEIPVEVGLAPLIEGTTRHVVVSVADISVRKQHQDNLARLSRTYATLSACNHILVHADNETTLLQSFCRTLVTIGGFSFAQIYLSDPELQTTPQPVTHTTQYPEVDRRLCIHLDQARLHADLTDRAIREGATRIARISEDGFCLEQCPPARQNCGHKAVVALPLCHNRATLGVMLLYASESKTFDNQAITMLEELANDLAFGLISLRSRIAQTVAEAALHLRDQAIQAASNGIMIVDAKQHGWPLIYANPAFERITGYSTAEALGRNPAFLANEERGQTGMEAVRSALASQEPITALLHNYRKNGTPFWNELHIAPVIDEECQVSHYVGILNDVSERVRYEQELEYQASYDGLTGLINRHLLADRITQALTHTARYECTCAVLFLDLDRFKLVNDSLGHHAGDELLKILAKRLITCGREEDTIARYGGDEFVVVLPNLTRPEDIGIVAERMLSAITKPVTLLGNELRLSVSIGAAFSPRDGITVEALLRCADIAMFRSKEAGGNRLMLYQPDMSVQLSDRLHLERDLRIALVQKEIIPHYQPQIELATGHLIGIEALARWHHSELGPISPAKFIPLAEDTGLIEQLGELMLEQVCRQVTAWRDQGLMVPTVAVNLSPHQLALPDIDRHIAEILARTGISGRDLELEVTEGALMHSPEDALLRLNKLKELGIQLSLDDFGTGYSSLSYLKRFPFDMVKIDKSFIRDLPSDANDSAITLTIINMSRNLGLKVLAEGVETKAQHQFLLDQGCDYSQGWLYDEPLSAQDMAKRLTHSLQEP